MRYENPICDRRYAFISPHNFHIFYSVKQTCEVLSLGKTSVFALIREKKIISVKIRRRTLVLRQSVDDYIVSLLAGEANCHA